MYHVFPITHNVVILGLDIDIVSFDQSMQMVETFLR